MRISKLDDGLASLECGHTICGNFVISDIVICQECARTADAYLRSVGIDIAPQSTSDFVTSELTHKETK